MSTSVDTPISPGQSGRSAMKVPPVGGISWGTEMTKYGGIGPLPFLGKVKVRDLPVPRSHRHFGCGVNNYRYEAVLQPYNLTSLRLSEGRMNDQLLPPVCKVTIDPQKCHVGSILEDVPYATHTERTEMFPKGLNEGNEGLTRFPLAKATRDDLAEYRKKLYNASTYGVTWPREQDQCNDGNGESQTMRSSLKFPQTAKIPFVNRTESSSSTRSKDGCTTKRVRFADQDSSCVDELPVRHAPRGRGRRVGGLAPCWPPAAYLLDKTFQIKEDLERFPVKKSNNSDQVKPLRAVTGQEDAPGKPILFPGIERPTGKQSEHHCTRCGGGRRPSSTSCACCDKAGPGEQNCGTDGYGIPLTCVCKRWSTFEDWKERIRRIGLYRTINTSTYVCETPQPDLPQTLNEDAVEEKEGQSEGEVQEEVTDGNASADDNDESETDDRDAEDRQASASVYTAHLRLPRQPFPSNPLFQKAEIQPMPLPPIPLCECLVRCGDRIPCRLGLSFKTKASERFYAVHPDPIPDLRRSHNERKRYFFYGYHASAFRG